MLPLMLPKATVAVAGGAMPVRVFVGVLDAILAGVLVGVTAMVGRAGARAQQGITYHNALPYLGPCDVGVGSEIGSILRITRLPRPTAALAAQDAAFVAVATNG